MNKYIDADKLIAEIENFLANAKNDEVKAFTKKDAACYLIAATTITICIKMKKLIASLKQETELPEKYQTPDWLWEDKTIDQLAEEYVEGVKKCNDAPTWDLIHTAICYGYELGLNARKEE